MKESYSSSYTRSFQLPENALRDQIHAELERGRMKIVVPKDSKKEQKPQPEPKKVKVHIE